MNAANINKETLNVPGWKVDSRVSAWNQFIIFCAHKNYVIWKDSKPEYLAEILRDWAWNMKRQDGREYKENVVKIVWNISARRLQEVFRTRYQIFFDPFKDKLFKEARDARKMKVKQLRIINKGIRQKRRMLNDVEYVMLLNEYDEDTSSGLIQKFYHISTKILEWKVKEASGACVFHFKEKFHPNGESTGKIEYNAAFKKSGEELTERQRSESQWLETNHTNSTVCPVRLFKKLISRRGPNVLIDRLFLSINYTNPYNWYRNSQSSPHELKKWALELDQRIEAFIDTTSSSGTIHVPYFFQPIATEGNRHVLLDHDYLDQGHSSSLKSSQEINDSSSAVSDDDSATEEMYTGEADLDYENPTETKISDMIEVSDTQVISNVSETAKENPDLSTNVPFPTADECDVFGEYISKHLQQLPLSIALKLQSGIHELVMQTRLEYVRQNPNKAPPMVKEEKLIEEVEPTRPTTSPQYPQDPMKKRTEKRPRATDPPDPNKRPKPNTHSDSIITNQANDPRTDVDVFAKHIKMQLEQLPDLISLQLRSDIYAMIVQAKTKTLTKNDTEVPGNSVRIKDEVIETDHEDLIDSYDLLSS